MSRLILVLGIMLATAFPTYASHTNSTPQDDRVFPRGDSGAFDSTPLTDVLKEGIDSKGAIYR